MMNMQMLDRLCAIYGIAAEYTDVWDKQHPVPVETRMALLQAMGVAVTEQTNLQAVVEEAEVRPWRRLLAPVLVVRETMGGAPQMALHVAADQAEQEFEWTLILENGERQGGRFRPCDLDLLAERTVDRIALCRYGFSLPFMPWCGYHHV
ncbi:MAG: hypothetical protein V2J55_09555, partial [Candidatus Competibacteraceae bacterium]|nr:hypothetical protein [Candidatus Competibacteraceae bacterium]